jgi:glutathione synthase/RimK-type ligase-like ATP-grasp enzyme
MLQNFLKIEEEFRVFVVGKKALGTIKKNAEPNSLIANYAAGATFHASELPKRITQECVNLCVQQGIDIGGVDIARVGDNYYLLEINRCPEFKAFTKATGIPIAKEIITFIASK